jgi:hypothetical protein
LEKISTQEIIDRISQLEQSVEKGHNAWPKVFPEDDIRYNIGALYLKINDTEGAINHFLCFEALYPQDNGEPFHFMAWTIALYRNGDLKEAEYMFLKTMLQNEYLFPILFGQNPELLDGWHRMTLGEKDYISKAPKWILDLWEKEEINWAMEIYQGELCNKIRERYATIKLFMKIERDINKLGELLLESSKLEKGDYSSLFH